MSDGDGKLDIGRQIRGLGAGSISCLRQAAEDHRDEIEEVRGADTVLITRRGGGTGTGAALRWRRSGPLGRSPSAS
jgi:cell division GTPase FtsZ